MSGRPIIPWFFFLFFATQSCFIGPACIIEPHHSAKPPLADPISPAAAHVFSDDDYVRPCAEVAHRWHGARGRRAEPRHQRHRRLLVAHPCCSCSGSQGRQESYQGFLVSVCLDLFSRCLYVFILPDLFFGVRPRILGVLFSSVICWYRENVTKSTKVYVSSPLFSFQI